MQGSEEAEEVSRGTKRKASEEARSGPRPRRIKPLAEDVVNKIAAGEIIVAPVNALKELTENAVDAGSTSIEIVVKEGGLKLLQITDNGHGIDRDDLPVLCERFTTSKLKVFEDLSSIGTYGFRGEALASISHIAHLQVTTKVQESSCAWRALYADGKLVPAKPGQSADPKPCAGKQGTQITVEDLFYNVPMRRRAFRSAGEEYAKILDVVGRYAVHCSGVAFSCKKQGESSLSISVPAAATTLDRIRQIHGNQVARELLQFDVSSDPWGFKCNGWVSNANYHVKKLALLLFINHRAVESSAVKRAVERTYSEFLPKGGHPFVYLSLNIDPQRVDVNVHPTKREVNFLNEDEIVDLICEEVRSVLSKVDTSRTFMTQSLLPGVEVPTISADTVNTPLRRQNGKDLSGSTDQEHRSLPARTPQTKPYENNLVRTDSQARKITSMFQYTPKPPQRQRNAKDDRDDTTTLEPLNEHDEMEYEYEDREVVPCRLTSVKELRSEVRETQSKALSEVFAALTFVGIVDERRRLAAIQSGVKLFLVDYAVIFGEYFYQLGLTDFGNYGRIRLDPPLDLQEVLELAAELESQDTDPAENEGFDWANAVAKAHDQLLESSEMLSEYFSLDISTDGQLTALPLLVKGYLPSMAKLPRFLLRLGPFVNWTDEKECFRTFLRELAAWYVPEQLPPPPAWRGLAPNKAADGELNDQADEQDQPIEEDPEITTRRNEVATAIEHVLFPAVKTRLVAVKSLAKGAIEVANLKGLYRVFERC